MNIEPVTLQGRLARLEPLRPCHAADLLPGALDPDLWRWTPSAITSAADVDAWIDDALDGERAFTSLPFLIRDAQSGAAAGSTRFGNISSRDRRVEIGWTWILSPFQRTGINTEAKYLLLSHAFDTWRCNRVELKTDLLNARSRAAILRIGAVEEGTLRQHIVTDTGRIRDTVYFSVVRDEWPAVRNALAARLLQTPGL